MGLGKTFVGSEKLMQLGEKVNLVICQKSKVNDWIDHFNTYYKEPYVGVINLTVKGAIETIVKWNFDFPCVGVINYDLVFRRPELKKLNNFTLLLDESSLIQNETAKRSKFIMKLNFKNLILLSGTPTGGKYERLWSQLKMLGYPLTKQAYYNMYVNYYYDTRQGFPLMIIKGYKNVDRLKRKLREYGCVFMKSNEVFNLPKQTFINVNCEAHKQYKKFRVNDYLELEGKELIGDTTLTKMLYERQLCGMYSNSKLEAFRELLEATDDRLIVFYNFNEEWHQLGAICDELNRPCSIVNGQFKNLKAYEGVDNSITFIQYQAGAMGLNLQKANKIVYFTPPLSSELYEQSKKRIHRIGQEQPCFYYRMVCKNSIEENIYRVLEMRKDYTDKLFLENSKNSKK